MLSIRLPENTQIIINETHIKIIGQYGTFIKKKSKEIKLYSDSKKLYLLDSKHFFYLNLIEILLWGANKTFFKKLKIIGIGFRATIEDNILVLRLGFSHQIMFKIPNDIQIYIPQTNILLIIGKNKQLVSEVAASIRSLKLPEPYKGKGIHYFDEIIIQKEGKKN